MIRETIITTVDSEGAVHIAPMGVRSEDGFVVLAPLKPSQTLSNLEATSTAVANYVDDVRIFAGCLTGRHAWPTEPAEKVAGCVLSAALAHEELEVAKREDDELRPRIFMRVAHSANHRPFAGFNRAQAAVIEGSILISRISQLPLEEIDSQIDLLSEIIETTAGEREREAWQYVLDEIDRFRESW